MTSQYVYLYNIDSGKVIYEKNADVKTSPAGLTAIMTAILAMENTSDLDGTEITAPGYIFDILYGQGAATADVRRGETISMRKLLYCLMLQSAAEAALTIADYVGDGSIDYFVEMMNAKAQELGCSNTNFVNAHGLYDENQYTTARDMAAIALHAMEIDGFMDIADTYSINIGPSNIHDTWYLNSTNYMIVPGSRYYYDGAHGIKTGSLPEAGNCLVTTATRDGLTYLLVILGAPQADANGNRYEENLALSEGAKLLDWAFNNFSVRNVVRQGDLITTRPLEVAKDKDTINVISADRLDALIPSDLSSESCVFVYEGLPDVIKAPIEEGTSLGKAQVLLSGTVIGEVNLVAGETVESSFFLMVQDFFKSIFESFLFKFILIFVILAAILYVVLLYLRNKNQKNRIKRRKRHL